MGSVWYVSVVEWCLGLREGGETIAVCMWHRWTSQALQWGKEVRDRRPIFAWFYFLWIIQRNRFCEDRKQVSVCVELGRGEIIKGPKRYYWDDENVLKLFSSNRYATWYIYFQNLELCAWNCWITWYVKYASRKLFFFLNESKWRCSQKNRSWGDLLLRICLTRYSKGRSAN